MTLLAVTDETSTEEPLDAISLLARVVLNTRLIACMLSALAVFAAGDGTGPLDLAVLSVVMTSTLLVLLRWAYVAPVLVRHPLVLALDVVIVHAGLLVVGVDGPYLYAVAGSAALVGLCLDLRGAQVLSPVFLLAWYIAVTLQPPATDTSADIMQTLVVQPGVVQLFLFGAVAVRRLLLRILQAERRLRLESAMSATAEERARLAREMHDTVSKSLYGLAMIAEALPGWLRRDPARAEEQAEQLAAAARQTVAESRQILAVMRADDLQASLGEAVSQNVSSWGTRNGRTVRVDVRPGVALGAESRYELLAVLNEALHNAERYTPSDADVTVSLTSEGAWVTLEVRDAGPGFEVPQDLRVLQRGGHYGLVGMTERSSRVGGKLTVRSGPAGTSVRLQVPASLPATFPDPRSAGGQS